MADLVSAQRAATKENVQRKQARTDGERDDSENEESEDDSPDEGDDDVPYNPKNLPLGWDGKVSVHMDPTIFVRLILFLFIFHQYKYKMWLFSCF